MWAERVTGPAFIEAVTAHGLATPDDLTRLAQAWRHWGTHPDGWFAVLHGEIIAGA